VPVQLGVPRPMKSQNKASHDTPSPKKARRPDAALHGDALAPDQPGSGGGGSRTGSSHTLASIPAAWGWTDRQAASPPPHPSTSSTATPPNEGKSESGGGSAPSPASPKPTPRSREPPATPPGPRANPPATTGGGGGAGAVLDAIPSLTPLQFWSWRPTPTPIPRRRSRSTCQTTRPSSLRFVPSASALGATFMACSAKARSARLAAAAPFRIHMDHVPSPAAHGQ